ncbi:hypothetical protein [Undibacterium terreum]|uniref:Uncharacterized protein n=1 Tax=Undibacterium terreum TaxID=1224302 RepID=A0A916UA84_9BURK|nr:hypothetical protein [Undibacterium terreum]GGC64868.1 hypothetical protein GCM10011396_09870 [Undibacterium terreum]
MTARIGSKHIAQHRGRAERLETKKANVEAEGIRRSAARQKYRNSVKGQAPVVPAAEKLFNN